MSSRVSSKPMEGNSRRNGVNRDPSEPLFAGSTALSSRELLRVLEEHVNRNYELDPSITEPWRKLPEIPDAEEILAQSVKNHDGFAGETKNEKEAPKLPENIVDSCWNNKANYIGAHYQLLREDAVAPLRNAVATYKANPMMNDDENVSIYTHIFIIGYTSSRIGMAARVQFSFERAGKRIRWNQSKRLQQGTIVALTTPRDNFKTICKIAVVAGRPLAGVVQNPPQVDLFWGDPRDATFDSTEEYVMVEARDGYFEANRHMLVALQKLISESFPFSNELVSLRKSIDTPKYLRGQPLRNLNSLSHGEKTKDESLIGNNFTIEDAALNNVDILDEWPVINGTKLDASQLAALKRILTKKLAIVQGPPGTGKTFVSTSALKVMLDNWSHGDSPIIISAQTNHALDQLLTLIAPIEPNFVRLGSRTSKANEIVRERTLYEVRTKIQDKFRPFYGKYRHAKNVLKELADKLRQDIENAVKQGDNEAKLLRDLKIITEDQYESLIDDQWVCAEEPGLPPGVIPLWLGKGQITPVPRCPAINMGFDEEEDPDFEELDENEAEMGKKDDDDDMDALSGEYFSVTEDFVGHRSYGGYTDRKIQSILDSTKNLWDIEENIRGNVYRYFRRKLKDMQLEAFRAHWKDYEKATLSMKIAKWEIDASMIKQAGIKLIGCTTTGLSKYRGLLGALKPRTLLIEEAAEALEGTILAAIFESLEHLILVGDHKQLQASCTLASLHGPPYNLGVSMFERLVRNGIEYTMLNEQRRMISEIRKLLNPFYEELKDHDSVLDRINNRKPIPGMGGKDTYFFHHNWPESRDDAASRFNIYEAEMIVNFFNYLVLNGIDQSEITVLTFYNGQRKFIQKLLRKQLHFSLSGPLNIFTVDSYQGEENDVIILSLVRSNDEYKVGFLENENRAVVSLSRARRGLYIFGNTVNLLMANDTSNLIWGGVTDKLRANGRFAFDGGLPLVCQNHHRETIVREPDDWVALTGGCDLKCGGQLNCGHTCPHQCHPFAHSDVICKEPCKARLECGHRCTERCGDYCRCNCNITQGAIIAQQDLDEPWQPNLDQVLGDLSNGTQDHPSRLHSRTPLQIPSHAPPRVPGSSLQTWLEWDAAKDDRALNDYYRAFRPTLQSAVVPNIVYKEIHRHVAVKEGSRVSGRGPTTRVVPRGPIVPVPQTEGRMGDLVDPNLSDNAVLTLATIRESVNERVARSDSSATLVAEILGAGVSGHETYGGTSSDNHPTANINQTSSPSHGTEDVDIYGVSDDERSTSPSHTPSAENGDRDPEQDLITFE